jgi:hypothetical protein
MIQLYFLSILCNGFSGYLLFSGSENETSDNSWFSSSTFHLVLGIMSAVVGILKLLSPILSPTGKELIILGDLVPAAAGVLAGFLLIFGIYRQDRFAASSTEGQLNQLGTNLMRFRRFIGLGLIGVALAHFLFPQFPFL